MEYEIKEEHSLLSKFLRKNYSGDEYSWTIRKTTIDSSLIVWESDYNLPTEESILIGIAGLKMELVIENIKEECNRRIRNYCGSEKSKEEWVLKSQNYQDTKHQYLNNLLIEKSGGYVSEDLVVAKESFEFAKKIISRKEAYRIRYKKIKTMLKGMSNEALSKFDPTEDSLWADLPEIKEQGE